MTMSQVSDSFSPQHPPQLLAADNNQFSNNANLDWLNMNDIFGAYNPIGMDVNNQVVRPLSSGYLRLIPTLLVI